VILSFFNFSKQAFPLIFALAFSQSLFAKELVVNQVHFFNAPNELTESSLQEIIDTVQSFLEWDLRKISVFEYQDISEFNSQHNLSFPVEAVFRKSDSTIHISPKVKIEDLRRVLSHELVHAIFFQKHKNSIPSWLEEGLANYIGKYQSPDYRWLKEKSWSDVSQMGHPSSASVDSRTYYSVSAGLIEMIAAKCNLKDLLQLSVGAKMTTYLKTYCEISDLNSDFKKWVNLRASASTTKRAEKESPNAPWWKRKKEKQWWQK